MYGTSEHLLLILLYIFEQCMDPDSHKVRNYLLRDTTSYPRRPESSTTLL